MRLKRSLLALLLFGIAFGYVEAAVVVCLWTIFLPYYHNHRPEPRAITNQPQEGFTVRHTSLSIVAFLVLVPLCFAAGKPKADKVRITQPVLFGSPESDKILASLQIFPPDNPWNTDVSRWPLHPNSRNIFASIGPGKPLHHNSDMNWVFVPPNQKLVPIRIVDYPGESDKGPFPIPDNLPIEDWPVGYKADLDGVQRDVLHRGGDRHGIIIDPTRGLLVEFYQALKTPTGWQCAQASVFDLKSNKLWDR